MRTPPESRRRPARADLYAGAAPAFTPARFEAFHELVVVFPLPPLGHLYGDHASLMFMLPARGAFVHVAAPPLELLETAAARTTLRMRPPATRIKNICVFDEDAAMAAAKIANHSVAGLLSFSCRLPVGAARDDLAFLSTPVPGRLVGIGTDSTDEPAVRVWAVLPGDHTDLDTRLGILDRVFDFIRERGEIPVQAYISFRTAAETGGRVHSEIPAYQRRRCTRRSFTAVIERCPDTGIHIGYDP